jgi:hypothetical protein
MPHRAAIALATLRSPRADGAAAAIQFAEDVIPVIGRPVRLMNTRLLVGTVAAGPADPRPTVHLARDPSPLPKARQITYQK